MQVENSESLHTFQISCSSCGVSRAVNELSECLRCGALVCGSRETNCKGACICDAEETSLSDDRKNGSEHYEDNAQPRRRFATELNRLMKTHEPRLTRDDLAEKLGRTSESVRKLSRGDYLPRRQTLIILSSIFSIHLQIFEGWVQESKLAKENGQVIADLILRVRMLNDSDREKVLAFVQQLE